MYKLIHWLGTVDVIAYEGLLEQEYLDSFLVAAQAVQPAWVDNNKFVFTCKYGWIDAGHFWATALMTFSMRVARIPLFESTDFDADAMAKLPYYVTTGMVEGRQGLGWYLNWFFGLGWLRDLELTPTAQSTGTPEDLESNWHGALFAAQILGDRA